MTEYNQYDAHDDKPSRTAIKKEMTALQELGAKIVELSEAHIERIPLDDKLQAAMLEARGMKHHGARRRQLQYIGKLMRLATNVDEIRDAYDQVMASGQQQNRILHEVERWRAELLSGDEQPLQNFLLEYPTTEIQHLRQVIRNAQREQQQSRPPSSARKLFRYLRSVVEQSV